MRRCEIFVLLVFFTSSAAAPLAAQEAQPESGFYETVEVNVINVEVFVTDKKGNPITDLTLADFALFEDGEPVEITNFYTVTAGRPPAAAPAAALAPAAAQPPPAAAPAPQEQRLTVVLFVDHANLFPHNQRKVLELLGEASWFQPTNRDRVMVVSHRGHGGVEVVQAMTDDPQQLAAALVRVGEIPAAGAHVMADLSRLARDMMEFGQEAAPVELGGGVVGMGSDGSPDPGILMENILNFSRQEYGKSRATLAALERFVDSLAGLPGRKALVYVSDGMSLRPAEALLQVFNNQFEGGGGSSLATSESANTDATPMFRRLSDHANANRVTFYTLLAGGGDARHISLTETQRTVGRVWGERVNAVAQANMREPMEMIAAATGGLAFVQPKTFEADLERLRNDFETFYSLGYSRPYSGSGKKHEIEVRVGDKKLRVRHREAYREKTSEELMSDRTLSALLFEVDGNPLEVRLEFGAEKAGKKGITLVPVTVKFPIARLLLMPRETHHEGQVSIFVAARDGEGRTSPVQKVPMPIRIPNEQLLTALSQVASFNVTLQMRDGEHSVVVGVRDELGDVESTTRASHTPGA